MSDYNEDLYIDGEDNKPKLIKFLVIIIFITILLVLIISCNINKKDSNAYLKTLTVENENLYPRFDRNTYNYELKTDKEIIKISCQASSKKAITVGCNKRIALDSDLNYSVIVNAENGNKKTYVIKITKNDALKDEVKNQVEDKDKETISEEITNKEDSDKKENSNTNANDEKTNTTNDKPKIQNDLTIKSITGNSSKWTTSVTLKVNAYSSNGIKYSFDGGKNYSSSNEKKFTSNGKVKIVVKDNFGNTKSQTITISKIDNTVPKVSIKESNKTNESVLLSVDVSPKTTISGYKYEWYKNDSKISEGNTYKATSSGNYKVKVITGTGKSTTSNIYNFTVVKVGCPKIEAITEDKLPVNEKTWIQSPIYFKVTPSSETVSFDVYYNEPGNFNALVENYSYFNTLQGKLKLRIVNSGIRKAKFVVRDKYGNSNICYSGVYYIK